MRILVTDSDTRAALASVRSLGRHGHEVVAAGERHPSLASVSRFAAAFESYPDPRIHEAQFVNSIVEIVGRREIDVVLPITDITASLLGESRQLLSPGCDLPLPAFESINAAADKVHVVRLAKSLAVPVPNGMIVQSAARNGDISLAGLGFPIVIKPSRSRYRSRAQWHSTGVSYAHSAADLRAALSALPHEAYPVLLQERIEGPGIGLFTCFRRGRAIAFFSHRRLREKPPSGGVSVLSESTAPNPLAVTYATRLLSKLDWHGVAMVEFKQDARDGTLRLMEINGRLWGSLELAVAAGVDFPRLLVEGAEVNVNLSEPRYRVGIRSRWLGGDLDALLTTMTSRKARLDLPSSHPGRLRSLWDFVRTSNGNVHYEIEQWDDLAPASLEWRRRLSGQGYSAA